MDLRQIKNLMKEFEQSTIHKLELSDSEFSIKLEKESIQFHSPSSIPVKEVLHLREEPTGIEVEKENVNQYKSVKAPLVGTYYESPSPESAPFVKLHDHVKKGDTLFIIEAMKVMNEIVAPVDGKVVNILCKNSSMVEFGQVVMEIEE
jgi:acetyl-CoA carboxylase biotin carboxyl carrier protein